MPDALHTLCSWLEQRSFAVAIAESGWWFPVIEIIHVFALAIVVGSISMIDFRLLGFRAYRRSIRDLTETVLPWTWVAFAVAASAGVMLFSSKATQYAANPAFQIKMVCLALAGVNMLTFHLLTARTRSSWDLGMPPLPARLAGALSLSLWITVVAAGRWIGFIDV
jgi:hypothetical protein